MALYCIASHIVIALHITVLYLDNVDNVAIDVASVTLGQTNSSPEHITSNREDRGGGM